MKVRLAIAIGVLLGALGGIGGASALVRSTPDDTGDWGCAVVRPVNQGVCFSNPLPPRLPLPSTPSVPA